MLSKSYSPKRKKCKVTFKLPKEVNASKASLLGDFSAWAAVPMRKLKDGSFSASVSLEIGRRYSFRYLLDEHRWENAPEADGYEPNPFGSHNSVIEV